MTRTAIDMPDEPDDGDAGLWRRNGELLRHGLVVSHHGTGAGSYVKATILRSILSAELGADFAPTPGRAGDDDRRPRRDRGSAVVPSSSDWFKELDLDVVVTTNYDRFLERDVRERCVLIEAKTVLPVATGRPWYARMSPQRLTGIAVFIAGRERADLGEEWRAHLCEQAGWGLPANQQAMEAAGFVRAAVRCRAEDVECWLWESVDAVLASRWMSSLFVLLAMVGIAVVFIRQGGLYGLADNIGGVAVVFATVLGVIHVGRKVRDVKPPERKPGAPR